MQCNGMQSEGGSPENPHSPWLADAHYNGEGIAMSFLKKLCYHLEAIGVYVTSRMYGGDL